MTRIAVPSDLRHLQEAHAGHIAGYFVDRKIYTSLRKMYWWDNMAGIRHFCCSCLVLRGRDQESPSPFTAVVGGPFSHVGIDVLQLPLSFEGNQYALVIQFAGEYDIPGANCGQV